MATPLPRVPAVTQFQRRPAAGAGTTTKPLNPSDAHLLDSARDWRDENLRLRRKVAELQQTQASISVATAAARSRARTSRDRGREGAQVEQLRQEKDELLTRNAKLSEQLVHATTVLVPMSTAVPRAVTSGLAAVADACASADEALQALAAEVVDALRAERHGAEMAKGEAEVLRVAVDALRDRTADVADAEAERARVDVEVGATLVSAREELVRHRDRADRAEADAAVLRASLAALTQHNATLQAEATAAAEAAAEAHEARRRAEDDASVWRHAYEGAKQEATAVAERAARKARRSPTVADADAGGGAGGVESEGVALRAQTGGLAPEPLPPAKGTGEAGASQEDNATAAKSAGTATAAAEGSSPHPPSALTAPAMASAGGAAAVALEAAAVSAAAVPLATEETAVAVATSAQLQVQPPQGTVESARALPGPDVGAQPVPPLGAATGDSGSGAVPPVPAATAAAPAAPEGRQVGVPGGVQPTPLPGTDVPRAGVGGAAAGVLLEADAAAMHSLGAGPMSRAPGLASTGQVGSVAQLRPDAAGAPPAPPGSGTAMSDAPSAPGTGPTPLP